jgi:hypothetical protein
MKNDPLYCVRRTLHTGAYREQDRGRGRELMVKLIDSISRGVPKPLTEVITLGRTLKKRATTSPDPCSRPPASDLNYTLICDEPATPSGIADMRHATVSHVRGN